MPPSRSPRPQPAPALAEGEAEITLAESELVVQRELAAAGASGARQVELAEAALVAANAKLAALRAELARAAAAAEEARAERTRAEGDLELRIEDRLLRDVATAELREAAAALDAARAALAEAELRLARVEVRAPMDGVVLERLAAAGDVLVPGAPVCSLYDPQSLRVRVDVPQGDVAALYVGQDAEILAESRAGRAYRGTMTRIVQRADIQKVTLEAQVRVQEPDDLLRPDMLAQVRFFGAARAGGEDAGARGETTGAALLALPAALVAGDFVWVLDPLDEVARRRPVKRGAPFEGDLVLVRDGIGPTDKVVDQGRAALEARGDDGDGVPVSVTTKVGEGR
jgi:RND family efflux transporter MFP subunit